MINASFRRLSVFKTVVDLEGVNAAAEHLGISQPSVTAHIKALELQAGSAMFVRKRGRRHLRLSPAGEKIYEYACDAIAKSEVLADTLRTSRAVESKQFMIAAQRILANYIMPDVIADFFVAHPGVSVTVHSEIQEQVWDLVNEGTARIGLMFGRQKPPQLHSELVGHLELKFIASGEHPLSKRSSIELAELAGYPFVGGLRESQFFRLIAEAMSEMGLENCHYSLNLQDSSAIKRAVGKNMGIALTFPLGSKDEFERGDLIVLPVEDASLKLGVFAISKTFASRGNLSEDLIKLARERLALA